MTLPLSVTISPTICANGESRLFYVVPPITSARIGDFAPTASRPFVLGLPTGSSPIPTYKALIKMVKDGKLSWVLISTVFTYSHARITSNLMFHFSVSNTSSPSTWTNTSVSPVNTPSPTTPSCSKNYFRRVSPPLFIRPANPRTYYLLPYSRYTAFPGQHSRRQCHGSCSRMHFVRGTYQGVWRDRAVSRRHRRGWPHRFQRTWSVSIPPYLTACLITTQALPWHLAHASRPLPTTLSSPMPASSTTISPPSPAWPSPSASQPSSTAARLS